MNNLKAIADKLMTMDNIHILTHRYPDGDTLGSAYALCGALQQLGKNAKVITSGEPAKKYAFLKKGVKEQDFKREYVVSVDVAATSLLGDNEEEYKDIIDICIDHHGTNSIEAKMKYVDATSASAAEVVFELMGLMTGVILDEHIASCIYTGLSTDTGCFRYTNTTPKTHLIAAKTMAAGAPWEKINAEMFEIMSPARIELQKLVYNTLELHLEGKVALIVVTLDMLKKAGVGDDEVEGLASIPRRVEGVLMGITIREKENGIFKISVRTNEGVDASAYCGKFGGGGHVAASGCTVEGTLQSVKEALLSEAERTL
ncbi:MAG: bifunctional oligoribonuclease/PAP phosphatase NrnA [Ruminococcaceae bacterium]|nr:bifunctional oligoribonuclease/PAP phosphatase NrnA [Oscillospiraceae bacterium]